MFIVIQTFWEEENEMTGKSTSKSGETRINPAEITHYFEGENGTTFITLSCGTEIVVNTPIDYFDAIMNQVTRVELVDGIKEN